MAEQGFEDRPSGPGAHALTIACYCLLGLPIWLALPRSCLELSFLRPGRWGGRGTRGQGWEEAIRVGAEGKSEPLPQAPPLYLLPHPPITSVVSQGLFRDHSHI